MPNVPPAPAHPAQAASHGQQSVQVSEAEYKHSLEVSEHLRQCIAAGDGWLSFRDWMNEALYAPGLGYYVSGLRKLAARDTHGAPLPDADFVTAPELSPIFGQTLARQIHEVMQANNLHRILEFGPGTGQLACDILQALRNLGSADIQYDLLEVSPHLKTVQADNLARHGLQANWLETLPQAFEGVIIANEVLDAMPVHIVSRNAQGDILERGVVWQDGQFIWADRPASEQLAAFAQEKLPQIPGYTTEICPDAIAWVRTLAQHLRKGLILLVDYGFTESEFFHPQRTDGTLMCHIQHRAHSDPFFAPGLQDITAHVDFSAIAETAFEAGLDVMGFTSQARFLLNAGLPEILGQVHDKQSPADLRKIEILISEAEMGELFKVLALGRDLELSLSGFVVGNRRHQL